MVANPAMFLLSPVLIGTVTWSQRRFGSAVGGLLAALPLTSGPAILLVALSHGPGLAASAAANSFPGLLVAAGFDLGYAVVALRGSWVAALSTGAGAYVLLGGRVPRDRAAAGGGGAGRVGRDRADGVVLAAGGRTGTARGRAAEVGSARADGDRGVDHRDGHRDRADARRAADRVAQPVAGSRRDHGGVHASAVRAIRRGGVSAHGGAGIAVLRGFLRVSCPRPPPFRGRARVRAGVSAGFGGAGRVLPVAALLHGRYGPSRASRGRRAPRRPRRRRR